MTTTIPSPTTQTNDAGTDSRKHTRNLSEATPQSKKLKAASESTTTSFDAAAMASSAPVTSLDAQPPLLIKKLSANATMPKRGSEHAAGYDLAASKETVIPARGKALVDTDLAMACPVGTCENAFFWPPTLPPILPPFRTSTTNPVGCAGRYN